MLQPVPWTLAYRTGGDLVHQLAALDAGFLYNETARAPQHIASVQILELPEGMTPQAFFDGFRALLLERVHLVPYFTNRLQWTPLDLDHPVWVRDEKFDIDHHVGMTSVAAPGGRREFEHAIAALHERALDLRRPLWEIRVLTGLDGGRVAFYNRVHHACLDGVSGQLALQAILDETPEPRRVEPPAAAFARRPQRFAPWALMLRAAEHCLSHQIRQSARVLDHVDTARRLLQRSVAPHQGLGALTETPPATRFNRMVQARRSWATAELPLAEMKRIGKATGTTMNDVFMAVCGGALRRYFERSGELPRLPLIGGCPVSLRRRGDDASNNQVTMMLVNLATTDADPVRRLLKVARSARQAKGCVADLAGSYDSDVALPGLPGLLRAGARALEAGNLADLLPVRPPCNVVISNVPGPREQLYCLGARVLTHYPVSIPAHTVGVNFTVQSYLDELFVGITGCARALPDPERLRDDLLASFQELRISLLDARGTGAGTDGERSEAPAEPSKSAAGVHSEAA
jgi:diacylglycerol O-acyltransferase / wax synthase